MEPSTSAKMDHMRARAAVPLGLLATGAAGLAYAAGYEVRAFRLRRVTVPVLPPGSRQLRVLQVSDLHLLPTHEKTVSFVRRLAMLEPDLVVDSGDNLAHVDAVPTAVRALEPLFAFPGVFVGGSNDYYAPRPKNPARYLLPDRGRRIHGKPLPWEDLRSAMVGAGWVDVRNRRTSVSLDGLTLDVGGVDDPHIWLDRYDEIAGAVSPSADLGLGLTHSPEPRVLSRFAADGFGLVLAGHTHGGQLRVPGIGALVTNSGLDTARARGLSQYDGMWLHVSAGLGTSPYTPVRFACPPEATLLTLVGR